ncbi:hypothetical protein [Corynebacterium pilosum]|uniref:Uncharacterized protein n=1 Tax=Corynebacterium pilosum TaxID=35756 RepID=A0A376CLJ4_9CORY|nr:hypothetical protein [Corynebacterium pilosum]STC69165.1 Uncharacterised protein [Corynebacterium pilosum]
MSEDLTRQRPSTAPYRMDYDWLWGSPETGGPGNDGSSATVRLTVTGPNARNAVMQWFDDLRPDEFGLRSRGGWLVTEMKWEPEEVIVDITSGGEDVADGIEDGTTEAFDVLSPFGVQFEWEQLPRDSV